VLAVESCDEIDKTRFRDLTVIDEVIGFTRPIAQVFKAAYQLRDYRVQGSD
jgi:hypothetical protein